MIKFMNAPWQTRAALALVLAMTLAGCGRRDDAGDDDGNGDGDGNGNPGQNNSTDTFAITSANRLVTFSRTAPAIKTAVAITGLAASETLLGFDVRPADGTLVGVGSSGNLYKINSDGSVASIAMLTADPTDTSSPFTGFMGTSFGVNFNPVPDRLRVVSNLGQNLRINPNNGVTTTDNELSSDDVTATTYTNSFSSACRTTLYYINTVTNQLLTTSNPNLGELMPVANLSVNGASINGASVSGFEVLTRSDSTNSALVVLTSMGTSTLMTISLNDATLTNSQPITGLNANETITAISMAPPNNTPTQTLGELVAVTQSNRLISFNAAAPQKLCTPATRISNLQAGDNVLGIDVRPKDGLLYTIGSSGRLYTISTVAGNTFAAATMGPLLQAASGSQFSGLSGNDFGFDFNPMADRLRVVSNNGQNLSIDVDNGTVTSGSRLNPGAPGVTAAAYDNNVFNAGSTRLFVIDTTNERLSIQGQAPSTPNMGDLTTVGTLALGTTDDLTGSSGFDISGRTGVAVAAFTLASSTGVSDLFTITLSSGLANRVTPVSTIGVSERIRGLAFATAPAPMLMAVTADNQLITFAPTAPETIVDAVQIDGLQGGESVIGLQVQANGKLQITSDAQRTYSLDAITGAAVLSANTAIAKAATRPAASAGVRFSATASTSNGLSFGAATTGLGQSRLFTLDANGTPTAVGVIGPSGTNSVRALAIRLN